MCNGPHEGRPCPGQRTAQYADGRLLRFRQRRLRHAVQDAGPRDGEARLFQSLLRRHHCGLICGDARYSSRSQPDHLLPAGTDLPGQGVRSRLCARHPDGPVHDGRCGDHLPQAQLPQDQGQVPQGHRNPQAAVHLLLGSGFPLRHHHRYAYGYVHSL